MKKIDWKITLIIITALIGVVVIAERAIASGHDGALALTTITGFFGLAMFLSGKKAEKSRITKALKVLKDGEDKEA